VSANGASGVHAALRFIAAARSDPALGDRLAELGPECGLAGAVTVAADAGFSISVEDLRAAYVHDWGLRHALAAHQRA